MAAGAEVVKRAEAVVDTRDRDPPFEVIQVLRNYEVIGNYWESSRPSRVYGRHRCWT
jgi:hypothetical protein